MELFKQSIVYLGILTTTKMPTLPAIQEKNRVQKTFWEVYTTHFTKYGKQNFFNESFFIEYYQRLMTIFKTRVSQLFSVIAHPVGKKSNKPLYKKILSQVFSSFQCV